MAGNTFLIEITRGILHWPTGNPRLGIQKVTYIGGTVVESPLNLVQMVFFFLKSHKIVGNLEFVAIYRLSFIMAIYRWFLLVKSAFNAIYNEISSQNDFPSPVESQEMFDWNRAWYPIAPLEYLNADAPNPVKLLGKRMVLWCSNQDTWSGWFFEAAIFGINMNDLGNHKWLRFRLV